MAADATTAISAATSDVTTVGGAIIGVVAVVATVSLILRVLRKA